MLATTETNFVMPPVFTSEIGTLLLKLLNERGLLLIYPGLDTSISPDI